MTTTPSVSNQTTNTNTSPTTSTTASAASADYQSFLKLLVAQMKNQDPTEPMDSTQYVSQLATFSNVEQAVQMNSKLEQLLGSFSLSQADGLIGRTVTSADGTISGEVESVRILQDGMVAKLADGSELAITTGVTIS
ncbi:flagellar basal body rod modification protein [Phyllobacterium phragmitis]|uniref:Basal-body rod modification protein FlgD n=1 Tax=Phyllobacterium phragmitis TaxID=2670329 RepID=A0A2S9IQ55_9HYPH|nr:flagellar hook assembly protein FlgD [Phyllobacterium phragmitis]PRD42656.1 flagellar basal body rod modification protein [Phyllobacterium phragmitis]